MPKSYRYNLALAFAAIADEQPERAALRLSPEQVLSYRQLDRAANQLASVLADRGLEYGDALGIVHTKSPGCYAAMLAAHKLGASYVNLDDTNPAPRLKHIFSTARPKMVLAETMPEAFREALAGSGAAVHEFSDPRFASDVSGAPADEPMRRAIATGSDPAYINFTSGSTGIPKGAIVTHDNVLNFCRWARARLGIEPADVLTGLNPPYFDVSVFDFFGALLAGASVVPVPRETLADPSRVIERVEQMGCTVWCSVPSLLVYLTALKLVTAERLSRIRQFVYIGEVYPKPELRKLWAAFGHRSKIVNTYGPTECTVMCSAHDVRVEDLDEDDRSVPLGPIADNCAALVLDEGRQVAPGEVGELYVMGPQVGLGYINDPERTEKAFVSNPLNDRWSERAYKTGDLVRLGADGRTLEYVGRADNQIKHMGYRIELEEIETALNRQPGVIQSAVVHKPDSTGVKILAAYVAAEGTLSKKALRDGLLRLLPAYMIPQHIEVRNDLPKNANGKVDRVALAAE